MPLFTLIDLPAARAAHSSRRALAGGFLLLLALLAGLARPALAQTTTFGCTGSPQFYLVPAGITQLRVVARGAWAGAAVQATVTVTPGEQLTVMVGSRGTGGGLTGCSGGGGGGIAPGFNGGGGTGSIGIGGGATDLRRSGSATGDYLTSRNALLVAGGGGSSTGNPCFEMYFDGGQGGAPNGGNGAANNSTYAGVGATQTGPGTSARAAAGSNNVGGAGATGGGGGGGYYGGGGGASNNLSSSSFLGGGGGSSWVMPTGSSSISYATGTGYIDGSLSITTVAAAPTVTTAAAGSIVPGSAVLGGSVTADGGAAVTDRGVVYSTATATPTTSNSKVAIGTGAGAFTQTITGLAQGATYYVRAYAINSVGTSYGSVVTFSTPTLPAVAYTGAGYGPTSLQVGGNLTADGGTPITSYGAVFMQGPGTPTIANSVMEAAASSPAAFPFSFWVSLPGITPATQYTVRLYATNAVGTSYSGPSSFLTPPNPPEVSAPANNSRLSSTTPTYGGTALPGGTVTVYVDNASIGTTTASADGSWTLAQPTALAQGSHMVRATVAATVSGLTATSQNSNTSYFTVDNVSPTVVISSTAGTSGSTIGITPIPFTVTFSEAVTGFVAGDLTVTNGTVSSFTGSGTTYTFRVTPTTAGTPTTVSVPANVAQDLTGNANTAATTLSLTYVTPTSLTCPTANNALNFDGADDIVRSNSPLPALTALTLEAWVYQEANGGFRTLLNGDDFPGGAVHCHMTNGTMQFTVNGSSPNDYYASTGVALNTWAHVAVVYTSTGGAGGTVRFYLNGAPLNTITATSTTAIASQSYSVGAWFSGSAQRFFDGSLNELRVWSVARTDAQIAANYQAQLPAQAGLIARYSFNQGTANGTNTAQTTLADESGSGRTGTLTGFALSAGTQSNYVTGNSLNETLTLAGFAPASGVVGQVITLTGTGFTGAVGVSFNGTPATVVTLVNSTTITARVPAGTTAGTLNVTTACGTVTNAAVFTVCAAPVALARNAGLTLSAGGIATLAATAVNDGSTASCGPAAAGALSVSRSSFGCADVVPATVASALSLNGIDQYISLPATTPVPVGNAAYTIEAWIKPTAMGVYGIIGWGEYGTGNQVNALRLTPNGLVNYWWGPDLTVTTGSLVGAWHHVAATFNGTTRTIYLDGVAVGSDTPGAHTVPDARNLRIGSTNFTNGGSGEYFPGSIDEVRVWSVGRTAAQINAAKGIGLPGGTAGLVAYYRLNEGSGTAAQAATGTAASLGTLTNGATWTTDAAPVVNGVAVTLTVTDAGGTTATAPAVVTVLDITAPTAVARNVSVALTAGGTATVTAAQVNNSSTDNCTLPPNGTLSLTETVTRVVNGTFDANATGWTAANVDASGGYFATGGNPGGTFILNNNGSATDPTLSQTVTGLVSGATYVLRGDYRSQYVAGTLGTPAMAVDLYGSERATFPAVGFAWAPFSLTFTATGPSLPLAFRGEINGTDTDIVLDNLRLNQVGSDLRFTCANAGANPVTLTVTDASGNTATAAAVVTVSVPATPTTTWTGAASTAWTDCANWSYGKVPDAATNAVVPAGLTRYPALATGTFPVQHLTIDPNGALTLNGDATLQVSGNWTNNGTATLLGTVEFVGSAATQALGGSTAPLFPSLVVNKASGTVQLSQHTGIGTALTLTSGTLSTGSYRVNLGGLATLSETETAYVVGEVATSRPLVAAAAESFGGLGLTLTPAPGSTAPGATLVTRSTGTALTGVGTSVSILRSFDIVPTVKTALDVTMDFAYFTHELNGIPTASLALFKSASGTAPWIPQHGVTFGTNVVTKTGITDFSVWTLGNAAAPLPVELAAFTAMLAGPAAVQLKWATASEKNSARFEVERSADGKAFYQVGVLPAASSSNAPRTYALLDAALPTGAATLYYRLKQVDADDTFSYSPVRTVALTGAAAGLNLYPNPTHGAATLTGTAPGTVVTVSDALSRPVATATADAAGTAALVLPAGLPAGVYVVRAGSKAVRLTVE